MAMAPASASRLTNVKGRASPLTHFLCLPLSSTTNTSKAQLEHSLEFFKRDVLSGQDEKRNDKLDTGRHGRDTGGDRANGVDRRMLEVSERNRGSGGSGIESPISPKSIRPIGSLHLTLGVMSLVNTTDVQRALEVLRGLNLNQLLKSTDTTESAPTAKALIVSLKSLTSMHPPDKTSILYANPEDTSGRLLSFCQSLVEAFKEVPKENGESLLVKETRPLLLHATIVNTIYAKGGRGGPGKAAGQRGHGKFRGKITFDAQDILERYKNYEWMKEVRIEKVAICRMGAKKVLDEKGEETGDEEYVVEGEVDMP